MRARTTAAIAAALMILSAGCTTTPESGAAGADLTPVTVVLDWTPNTNHLGLYVAQERGYFTQAGLDVTIVEPGEALVAAIVVTSCCR